MEEMTEMRQLHLQKYHGRKLYNAVVALNTAITDALKLEVDETLLVDFLELDLDILIDKSRQIGKINWGDGEKEKQTEIYGDIFKDGEREWAKEKIPKAI